MDTVYKYKVSPTSEFVSLPKGAEVLTFGDQKGEIYLWARVDPDAEIETRRFTVVGTGHDMESGSLEYINTIFVAGFVFHAFEVKS